MKVEQRDGSKREKFLPVFWKDERIGVYEERMFPPGYHFSKKDPILTHYQNKEHWLVGSLDIRLSNEITVPGVILVSNDEHHSVLSMVRAHWKEYEFVEVTDRRKMERGKVVRTPMADRPEVSTVKPKKEVQTKPGKSELVPAFWQTVYQKTRPEKGLKPARLGFSHGRHK